MRYRPFWALGPVVINLIILITVSLFLSNHQRFFFIWIFSFRFPCRASGSVQESERCSSSIKPEYIVHDGDVVFSWSSSLLVDFWCGGDCGLNQHLFKVTSLTFDKWFYYSWTQHHLNEFIAIAADKATTMGHIKRENLQAATVLIPPSDIYKEIGRVLEPIYEAIIRNRVESKKLVQLRNALLPKLMSGELDVSEVDV